MLLPAQEASNAAGLSRPSKRKGTVVSRMLEYGSIATKKRMTMLMKQKKMNRRMKRVKMKI